MVHHCVAMCIGEVWKEVFRCVAMVEKAGVELLDFMLCISFVGAEVVESEGAARY